jgi:hypothetical protein
MKAIEAGIQDSSFQNYMIENRDRILISHRVPLSKIGSGSGGDAGSVYDDKNFKEQVTRPAQDELEIQINKIVREFTDAFKLKFNELTLTDELAQAQIDQVYLVNKTVVPNEIRMRMGKPPIDGGDEPIDLHPAQAAEKTAQATDSRSRDQQRNATMSEKDSGRNPKGAGRKNP